jgi:hypothetical protein
MVHIQPQKRAEVAAASSDVYRVKAESRAQAASQQVRRFLQNVIMNSQPFTERQCEFTAIHRTLMRIQSHSQNV